MLNHQTAEKLRSMKLPAMAAEYIRQAESPDMDALDFSERFGMLADAEWLARKNNRVRKLIVDAKLRIPTACFADLDYRPSRKLDRAYLARLSDFAWVREAKNAIITGCTGTGKTWLACAFGAEACRKGLRVSYQRVTRLLNDLAAASASGDLAKLLNRLKKADLLILDDWGLNTLNPLEGRLLLEVFEDRFAEGSTIIAAQLPVSKWHGLFEDSTAADAVLDRVVHNSYRFVLQGPSMRRQSPENEADQPVSDSDNDESSNDLTAKQSEVAPMQ
jgi:DNA replication protein DnaC